MVEIPLCGKRGVGLVTIVDDEDAPEVRRHHWRLHQHGYAYMRWPGGRKNVYVHTLLFGLTEREIDHINGTPLDNRRANLRPCTHRQNTWNMRSKPGSSQFKGVSWDAGRGRWRAALVLNGSQIFHARFADETAAALAYDAAVLEYFGDFARLNFPVLRETA